MYTKELPKPQEIRYWVFVDTDNNPYLVKVKVLRRWFDKENGYYVSNVTALEHIIGEEEAKNFGVDSPWQMQKTLEDARKVMLIGIFKGDQAFFHNKAPWE